MKKLVLFSLGLALATSSCYDEYKNDYEGGTTAYFSYQYPVRTMIVGNDDNTDGDDFVFKVGANYGGLYSYEDASQTFTFEIVDTLITNNQEYVDAGIKVMSPNWYKLSHEFEIKAEGKSAGFVEVKVNIDSLTTAKDAYKNTYAIPFLMTGSTTDHILDTKNYSIVVVKYKNQWDGRYYLKGVDYHYSNALGKIDTVAYSEFDPGTLFINESVFMNTISKDSISISRIGNNVDGEKFKYNMYVNSNDWSGIITPAAGSDVKEITGGADYTDIELEGEKNSTYKGFISDYVYMLNGVEHTVRDTLIYADTRIVQEEWK